MAVRNNFKSAPGRHWKMTDRDEAMLRVSWIKLARVGNQPSLKFPLYLLAGVQRCKVIARRARSGNLRLRSGRSPAPSGAACCVHCCDRLAGNTTLSLAAGSTRPRAKWQRACGRRSEEHTSELQSLRHL